jgi:hypothetical protein
VLWRHDGEKSAGAGSAFVDVAIGDWFYDAVLWASENDIIGGYGNGSFGPNDPLTREQFVVILYRHAQKSGKDMSQRADIYDFTDADDISDWAREAMTWAIGSGLINGRTATVLAPGGTATRAEAATLLQRYIEWQSN